MDGAGPGESVSRCCVFWLAEEGHETWLQDSARLFAVLMARWYGVCCPLVYGGGEAVGRGVCIARGELTLYDCGFCPRDEPAVRSNPPYMATTG